MRTEDFDFDLPRERIAQRPAEPRDAARLLVVPCDGPFEDAGVRDLPDFLAPGDLLVFNDTKVIPARLHGKRGAVAVEILLHRPEADTLGAKSAWRCFARPAKRLKPGQTVIFAEDFAGTVTAKHEGGEVTLAFDLSPEALRARLERHGQAPLPPYIARPQGADARDRRDYQTIFARREGAVAAPTAGLHFTEDLLAALDARGIARAAVTLHVGAGTFLPVKTEDPREHPMHGEWGEIPKATAEAIEATRAAGGRIIAVGTTSLRVLEGAAARIGRPAAFAGEIDLFILPGFTFRVVDLLLTNFHLPRSTLFMLVAAFSGLDRMRSAYAHAVEAGYRFYSYGDACLLERRS